MYVGKYASKKNHFIKVSTFSKALSFFTFSWSISTPSLFDFVTLLDFSFALQIRVVNAFRSGLENRNNPSSSSTSFAKRSSTLSGLSSVTASKVNSPDPSDIQEPSCSTPKSPEAKTEFTQTVETTV